MVEKDIGFWAVPIALVSFVSSLILTSFFNEMFCRSRLNDDTFFSMMLVFMIIEHFFILYYIYQKGRDYIQLFKACYIAFMMVTVVYLFSVEGARAFNSSIACMIIVGFVGGFGGGVIHGILLCKLSD